MRLIKLNMKDKQTRRGVVALMAAVCLVALIAVLALSLDAGSLMSERRRAQSVADAAALAGAADLFDYYWTNSGDDPNGTAVASALTTAKNNGYNHGVTATVTVTTPPATGYFANRRGYIEVNVEYQQRRGFSTLFGSGTIPIKARAVAIGSPVAVDVGILALDPDDKGALTSMGSGVTDVKDTPVIVNSAHTEAAIAGGGGFMKSSKFAITGNYTTTGGGQFDGPIRTGATPTPDPLVDLPVPDKLSMIDRTPTGQDKFPTTQGDVYLQPGLYRKGISVSGTGNLYLAPGIYYMDGGGFKFSGQGTLKGEGVMIYNDPGNGQADGIEVTGQGSMILTAPETGIYQGVTFFQDRTSNVGGVVTGTGGQTDISGTFYFAGAHLSISGNGGVSNIGSQYISNTLSLGGTGGINVQWAPDKVARKRNFCLVE